MSYLKIPNLYKEQTILMYKECFALEKIHGSSAHISFQQFQGNGHVVITHHSSGASSVMFKALFNDTALEAKFLELFDGTEHVTIYGEGCGGKLQKMRHTYGDDLRFVPFDVKVGDVWVNVPSAKEICDLFKLGFVSYRKIPATLEAIDAERDRPSELAKSVGIKKDMPREGIVLRPLVEMTLNNGDRVISKHKGEAFQERMNQPKPKDVDPARMATIAEAQAIAFEWVTPMRLSHVEDKMDVPIAMQNINAYIKAMIEDVYREAKGEIVESKATRHAIGAKTAELIKAICKQRLEELHG